MIGISGSVCWRYTLRNTNGVELVFCYYSAYNNITAIRCTTYDEFLESVHSLSQYRLRPTSVHLDHLGFHTQEVLVRFPDLVIAFYSNLR